MYIQVEVTLTEAGKDKYNAYIEELKAKRKRILDAGGDTADNVRLPSIDDICCDITFREQNGVYHGDWGISVTDHYSGHCPLELKTDIDYK